MTALAADRNSSEKGLGHLQTFQVAASAVIFKGGLVSIQTANGFVVPGSDTAAHLCAGIAQEYVDNSGGLDGAKTVQVRMGGVARLVASGLTQANVLGDVTIVDDQTVGLAAVTLNDVIAGRLLELDGSDAWVQLRNRTAL